jgi:hypothetical protein
LADRAHARIVVVALTTALIGPDDQKFCQADSFKDGMFDPPAKGS